jgi:predicted RNase H-like HicB family nuclease
VHRGEDESFTATAPAFPGIVAFGKTKIEALNGLDRAIGTWIDIARKAGTTIPPPS